MPPGSWSNLVSSRISGRVRRMISAIASTCASRFRMSLISRPAPRRPSLVWKVAIRRVGAEAGAALSAAAPNAPSTMIVAAIAAMKRRAQLMQCARLVVIAGEETGSGRYRIEPGRCLAAPDLVGRDMVHFFKAERDVVESVQQAVLAERINLEAQLAAIRPLDRLRFQVDRDHRIRATFGIIHQLVDFLLREDDGQDAVLEAVIVKDVGETRCDDAAYAEIQDCPGRMQIGRAWGRERGEVRDG